jgi:hypothetical protein
MTQRLDTLKDLQDWIDTNLKKGIITPETELTLKVDYSSHCVMIGIDRITNEIIIK